MLTVNPLPCTFLHKARLVRLYQVLLVVVLSYGFNATANATTCPTDGVLYVQQNGAGLQDGTSWANALATVQDALAVTEACEIWVAAGVYYPDEGGGATNDARASTFQLKNDVAIYGGFAGTEIVRNQRNWEANLTVLSGDLDQNDGVDANGIVTDTTNLNGSNSYHVVTGNGVNDTAKLDGVVITAGKADGSSNGVGGGMYNDSSSPTLNNVTFSGNSASSGGGMYNGNSSPTLSQVTFSNNSADFGGGMVNSGGSPTLTQVTFSENSASFRGGGMVNSGSSPTLSQVTFSDNSAIRDGGGMLNVYSSPILSQVTFSDNSAGTLGGGMFNDEFSSSTLNQVTFSDNSARSGGGIYKDLGNLTLTHTIIANSTSGGDCAGSALTSNGYNLDSDGSCGLNSTGDLSDVDPQLGPLADNRGATLTHALLAGSPAIDAGAATCATTDQRGVARPQGDHCDIGAVERITDNPTDTDDASPEAEQAAPNSGDANNDGLPDAVQSNVASFPAVATVTGGTGGGSGDGVYYAVEVAAGSGTDSDCTPVSSTGATTEANLGSDPNNYDYFAGLLEFTLNCEQAEVVLYFHGLSSAPSVIRKYGMTPDSPATRVWYDMPGATIETVIMAGKTVYKTRYTLTDGGVGDDDATDNGVIVDPVGPAWPVTGSGGNGTGSNAQNIPVFGPFGLLAMLIGLFWFGRRRKTTRV